MSPYRTDAKTITRKSDVLTGWKGIAGYFGCNVRTARRWEQERGLPAHRAPGKKGGTVFAHAAELDAWLESRGNEQGLEPTPPTSGTALSKDDSAQSSSFPESAKPPSAVSFQKQHARHSSFLRSPTWLLAVSALLLLSVALFWLVENRRAVAAKASAKTNGAKARIQVPANGTEDLVLRGRYFWNLRTPDGLAKAIDAYTQAIVTDPSNADAYAGLAECYDLLPQFAHADLGQSLMHAESAANRAIALNPNLAAAHRSKAFALFYWDWDIAGSDAEFKSALALDPDSAQTRQWYAGTLEWRSEGAEAIRQIDEAVRLDPTSPAIAADAALLHAQFGDFKSGVKALREIEQTQPTLASPAEFLSVLDFNAGDLPAYVEDLRRIASVPRAPADVALAKAVAKGWAQAGRTGLLQARAEALKSAFEHGTESGFALGETLLLLGRRQEALFYFKASLDRRAVQFIAVQYFPWVKELSSEPGYAALFAQVRERVHQADPNHPERARFATVALK